MNTRKQLRQGWSTWVGWLAVGLIVSWAVTVVGGIWGLASDRQALMGQAKVHSRQIEDHEQRVRVIERKLERIATDVQWIRRHLERNPAPSTTPATAAGRQEDE